jgi:uncharacterized membrane protein
MHTLLLTLHLLAAIVGVGSSVYMFTLMPRLAGSPDAPTVMRYAGANARKLGPYALLVLWITGVWLTVAYGLADVGGTWFWVKIAFVVVLSGLVGYSQSLQARLRRGGDPAALQARMKVLSPAMTGLAVLIVIAAVLAFG